MNQKTFNWYVIIFACPKCPLQARVIHKLLVNSEIYAKLCKYLCYILGLFILFSTLDINKIWCFGFGLLLFNSFRQVLSHKSMGFVHLKL